MCWFFDRKLDSIFTPKNQTLYSAQKVKCIHELIVIKVSLKSVEEMKYKTSSQFHQMCYFYFGPSRKHADPPFSFGIHVYAFFRHFWKPSQWQDFNQIFSSFVVSYVSFIAILSHNNFVLRLKSLSNFLKYYPLQYLFFFQTFSVSIPSPSFHFISVLQKISPFFFNILPNVGNLCSNLPMELRWRCMCDCVVDAWYRLRCSWTWADEAFVRQLTNSISVQVECGLEKSIGGFGAQLCSEALYCDGCKPLAEKKPFCLDERDEDVPCRFAFPISKRSECWVPDCSSIMLDTSSTLPTIWGKAGFRIPNVVTAALHRLQLSSVIEHFCPTCLLPILCNGSFLPEDGKQMLLGSSKFELCTSWRLKRFDIWKRWTTRLSSRRGVYWREVLVHERWLDAFSGQGHRGLPNFHFILLPSCWSSRLTNHLCRPEPHQDEWAEVKHELSLRTVEEQSTKHGCILDLPACKPFNLRLPYLHWKGYA